MSNTLHYIKSGLILALLIIGQWERPCLAYQSHPPMALSLISAELVQEHLPVKMVDIGIGRLRFVRFVREEKLKQATVLYYQHLNLLRISENDRELVSGLLKPASQLGAEDIGVIYHELWHSSFDRSEGRDSYVMNRVDTLYSQYKSNIREEIQEEAYGLFIQNIMTAYIQIARNLRMLPLDKREAYKKNPKIIEPYERVFSEKCFGYYNDRHLGPVFSKIPIEPRDKRFILHYLLEGKITGQFSLDFEKF